MAENEWVTGVLTLLMGVWSLSLSLCFCRCFADFQAVCKSDGWMPKNRNKHKNHHLPRFIYAQTACFHVAKLVKSCAIFLRWWFFITHLKTISSKRQLFSPPKMVVKRKQKPWNDDLGNCLRFLWLDSADDTRNSENQHSEALHFCRWQVWGVEWSPLTTAIRSSNNRYPQPVGGKWPSPVVKESKFRTLIKHHQQKNIFTTSSHARHIMKMSVNVWNPWK